VAVLGGRLRYGELTGGREQSERARMGGSSGFAPLFSLCWSDRPGQRRRMAATRRVCPGRCRPLTSGRLNRQGRFSQVMLTETQFSIPFNLLIRGDLAKTSVIQFIELHAYSNLVLGSLV
jgi:hypothetical protein